MATFDDVARRCSELTDVTVSTSYGTPALKVRGKMFCRLWGEREYATSPFGTDEVVVTFCDLDEKPFLIEESGGTIFSTAHYDGHGTVLLHLATIDDDVLWERLFESYLLKASGGHTTSVFLMIRYGTNRARRTSTR